MDEELERILAINPAALTGFFKRREVVGGVVQAPLVLRMDGVNFGRMLREFLQPRDVRVHRALTLACRELMRFFNGDFCYAVSDELNLLIIGSIPYAGRVFKLVSVSAGIASAVASLQLGRKLYFDSRVVVLESPWEAIPYVLSRMRIGFGNYVSKLFTSLVKTVRTPKLRDMVVELLRRGVDLKTDWRSVGTCLYFSRVEKKGFDPLRGSHVVVERRVVRESSKLSECVNALVETVRCSTRESVNEQANS